MRLPARAFLLALFLLIGSGGTFAQAAATASPAAAPRSLDRERRDILAFGIETELIALLDELSGAKDARYDADIARILASSRSGKLRVAILGYFAKTEGKAGEAIAVSLLESRDSGERLSVLAAFDYLSAIGSEAALPEARRAVEEREKDYLHAAVKALGAAGGAAEAELLSAVLADEESDDELKQRVVSALGELGDAGATASLEALLEDNEERPVTRIYAAQALGRIGASRSVEALAKASASEDPNLRAAAYEALGLLGKAGAAGVESAIVEGLRDPNAKARIAAVQASAAASLNGAAEALIYKASRDPERAVKIAAMKSLGALGGGQVSDFLGEYLENEKADAGLRALAFGALAAADRASAQARFRKVMEAASTVKDKTFRNALLRELLATTDAGLASLVEPLLADPDAGTRAGAIEWARRNKAGSLRAAIAALAESDPVEAIRRRAADAVSAF